MKHLTIAALNGYHINGGDMSTMTPLQRQAMICMTTVIWNWKGKNKPLLAI